MAVSLRAPSSFAYGSASLFASCFCNDSVTCCGGNNGRSVNRSLLLRSHPAGGLRLQRRRLVDAVRAEQGERKGNQADRGSHSGFSLPTLPEWAKWAFAGSIWLGSVPAWQKIRDVGRFVERVDEVVERVEELAEKADHMAEEIAEDLPDGEFKKVVLRVEKASEEVLAKARVLDDILDKTNDVVRNLYNNTRGGNKVVAGYDKEKDVPSGME